MCQNGDFFVEKSSWWFFWSGVHSPIATPTPEKSKVKIRRKKMIKLVIGQNDKIRDLGNVKNHVGFVMIFGGWIFCVKNEDFFVEKIKLVIFF